MLGGETDTPVPKKAKEEPMLGGETDTPVPKKPESPRFKDNYNRPELVRCEECARWEIKGTRCLCGQMVTGLKPGMFSRREIEAWTDRWKVKDSKAIPPLGTHKTIHCRNCHEDWYATGPDSERLAFDAICPSCARLKSQVFVPGDGQDAAIRADAIKKAMQMTDDAKIRAAMEQQVDKYTAATRERATAAEPHGASPWAMEATGGRQRWCRRCGRTWTGIDGLCPSCSSPKTEAVTEGNRLELKPIPGSIGDKETAVKRSFFREQLPLFVGALIGILGFVGYQSIPPIVVHQHYNTPIFHSYTYNGDHDVWLNFRDPIAKEFIPWHVDYDKRVRFLFDVPKEGREYVSWKTSSWGVFSYNSYYAIEAHLHEGGKPPWIVRSAWVNSETNP